MRGIAFVLLGYWCWCAALPSPAMAAEPPAHPAPVVDKEEAERRKEQLAQEAQIAGVKLFKEGRHREAEDRFQTACVLVPAKANPYYWLARARMAQSRCAEGLVSMQEFFRLATPTNSNRGDAELRRRQCEQQLATKARPMAPSPPPVVKAPPPRPTAPPSLPAGPLVPPTVLVAPVAATPQVPAPLVPAQDDRADRDRAPRPGATKKIVGGVLIGAGVAAAVAGAALGIGANGVASDVVNAAPGTPFDPALEESYRQGRASSIALLAAGGVVAVVGVVVLALGVRDGSRAPVALRPLVVPARAGAALSLRF